jgi:hypothetical protein
VWTSHHGGGDHNVFFWSERRRMMTADRPWRRQPRIDHGEYVLFFIHFSFILSFFLCFVLIDHGAPDASRTTALPFDQWCVVVLCGCDGMRRSTIMVPAATTTMVSLVGCGI